MRPEATLWPRLSEFDFETARCLLDIGIYYASVFFPQQSAEKALKALWIARKADLAPRTHNLIMLARQLGADIARFPSARHLASWAGICPGNHQSAGRSGTGRTRKGSPWLRSALVEAARAAARSRTYLGAQYHRIAARRGGSRAAVTVAHSILVIVYHMLSTRRDYHDLAGNYFGPVAELDVRSDQ